ncbi:SDR family NAD(P)-dependent oxidoreductase [Falsiruegeria mediterranea]|jgi:short-subunit dehydrogenase|uniref:Putative oxidoreductase n=1 Tax=Falsiruegeria mediterranea M17 TaxID=1200281 RepID=A0A2R8CCK4_9RHOB|nr:SDR family NAD(P)-dependent oxidoreductase [Falsiruegeria mediterranea]SPJ30135.1 putative oxidoreductase [Falsiruegeria mediterranea M17]
MFKSKTYWIIGASEGLGEALAKQLHQDGAKLILSARNAERLAAVAKAAGGARTVPLDVTDTNSVNDAMTRIGDLDGVIYCVGQYDPVPATDWQPQAVEAMCEANFMGAVRVLGHVVPRFVAKGQGHVVLIGSLAGHRGLPGSVGYGASKAALMHLGESLQADLRETDLKVQVINPGFIQTRLTAKNGFRMPMIQTPEVAAQNVMTAMRSNRLETNFPAPFSLLFTLGKRLPKTLFWRLFGKPENTTPGSGAKPRGTGTLGPSA